MCLATTTTNLTDRPKVGRERAGLPMPSGLDAFSRSDANWQMWSPQIHVPDTSESDSLTSIWSPSVTSGNVTITAKTGEANEKLIGPQLSVTTQTAA